MNIICKREHLLENINIVQKAISSRTSLPILKYILLLSVDGIFKMVANDLEMGIETSPIQSEVLEDGCIALEARIFSEIIHKMPNLDVSIVTDDKNRTLIKCGKSEFKIPGLPGDEFPYLPTIEKDTGFHIGSAELKNMIRQTIFAVSVDTSKPVLTGELLETKNGFLNVVAVDGFRVSYRKTETEFQNSLSVVVPAKTLAEVSKILPTEADSIVQLYFTDKHLLFELESCIVVTRLLEGEFLKYEQIFSDDCKTKIIVSHRELVSSLERASLITSKEVKKNPVVFQLEQDILTISSNTEFGMFKDEVIVECDGGDIEIAFNPKYLLDAVKALDEEKVVLQFTTSLSPCVVTGQGNENGKYLILPLRMKN